MESKKKIGIGVGIALIITAIVLITTGQGELNLKESIINGENLSITFDLPPNEQVSFVMVSSVDTKIKSVSMANVSVLKYIHKFRIMEGVSRVSYGSGKEMNEFDMELYKLLIETVGNGKIVYILEPLENTNLISSRQVLKMEIDGKITEFYAIARGKVIKLEVENSECR